MDKIAALTEILTADPANSFARYGLAMELAALGNPDSALAQFSTCIHHNPDYVPAYQMAAQTLTRSGRSAEAITMLTNGLAACARTGNTHAASEMQGMLDDLQP